MYSKDSKYYMERDDYNSLCLLQGKNLSPDIHPRGDKGDL